MADPKVTVPAGKITKALKDKRAKWRKAYYQRTKNGKNDINVQFLVDLIVELARRV